MLAFWVHHVSRFGIGCRVQLHSGQKKMVDGTFLAKNVDVVSTV